MVLSKTFFYHSSLDCKSYPCIKIPHTSHFGSLLLGLSWFQRRKNGFSPPFGLRETALPHPMILCLSPVVEERDYRMLLSTHKPPFIPQFIKLFNNYFYGKVNFHLFSFLFLNPLLQGWGTSGPRAACDPRDFYPAPKGNFCMQIQNYLKSK